jgi:hypothetical protein
MASDPQPPSQSQECRESKTPPLREFRSNHERPSRKAIPVSAKKIRHTPIHGAALRCKTRNFTIPIFHERWCTGKPALLCRFRVPDASGRIAAPVPNG